MYRQLIEQELRGGRLVPLEFLPRIQPREICIALRWGGLRAFAVKAFVQYSSGLL